MRDSQMALPLHGDPSYRPDDFVAAESNEAARRALADPRAWPSLRLALTGPEGCGKTHLVRNWARAQALLLAGATLPPLASLESVARVVIDAADSAVDEAALLHWINHCAEAARPLVLTARSLPSRLPVRLPDLASRLRATQIVTIDPPEDALLRALLLRLLAERQLAVPPQVQDWLLVRLPRTAGAVQQAVARLDAESLNRQRPVTLPLVRALFSDPLGLAALQDRTEERQ